MTKKQYSFDYEHFATAKELPQQDQELVEMAIEAAKKAYAPYSNFNVGASILLDNGTIVTGNNQENAAYPSGLCAERVALFYANANYPENAVKTIAVVAMKNNELVSTEVAPCGSCRQAILETETRFKTPIKMIMGGKAGFNIINNATELLPLSFTGDSL
ncbi:MAG: cytidine deaminase [Salinivirgaceae bacterium]|jgi:cytidine deaminase|nr:cytidine deaminase [Salinivirgaceae bacterium]